MSDPREQSHQVTRCFRRDCPPQTLNLCSYTQAPLLLPLLSGWVTGSPSLSQRKGGREKDGGREASLAALTLRPPNGPSTANPKFPSPAHPPHTSAMPLPFMKHLTYLHVLFPSLSHRSGASLVPQKVRKLPAMQETWVRSLVWEDPLKKEMATHSSILAWRILWTEESGSYSPWGCKALDTAERPSHTQDRSNPLASQTSMSRLLSSVHTAPYTWEEGLGICGGNTRVPLKTPVSIKIEPIKCPKESLPGSR